MHSFILHILNHRDGPQHTLSDEIQRCRVPDHFPPQRSKVLHPFNLWQEDGLISLFNATLAFEYQSY